MSVEDLQAPGLRSWVESVNDPTTDFPIQNLPFGIFRRAHSGEEFRVGIAIGDQVLDVAGASRAGLLDADVRALADQCASPALNRLMAMGREALAEMRGAVSRALRADVPAAHRPPADEGLLVPMRDVEMSVPAQVGDYSDFYASVYHATNVGRMLRPDNPLLPNYKWVPIGYHGRASSIIPTGTEFRRPLGQTREGDGPPAFGPTRRLDYELEIGMLVGEGNALGSPVAVDAAERHLFGLCLLNDWSARDIQTWEYQPLGPFLAKSFATTIGGWVVTMDALVPFRVPQPARPADDPKPLPYLTPRRPEIGGLDIAVEAWLTTAAMRDAGLSAVRLSRGSFADMYWTPSQLVAHHTSNGCNLRPGDMLASGTISGPTRESRGCLLELTWRGTEPIELPNGETRRFLEDGDEIVLRGYCERQGLRRIGFGECRGRIGAPATVPAAP